MTVMELPSRPRNTSEARFFVQHAPCERCGGTGLADERPAYAEGRYTGRCAGCGEPRVFSFAPVDRSITPPLFHLGPVDEPTRLFDAAQLQAIADRRLAEVAPDPTTHATLESFRRGRYHLERARVALNELAKHRPDDAAVAAEVARIAQLHAAYQAAEAVVDAKPGAHPPARSLDDRFNAHRHWVKRGRVGDGRLELRGEQRFDLQATTKSFVAAVVEDTVLERVNLSFGDFTEAVLRRSKLVACDLGTTRFERATLEHCDLRSSRLSMAELTNVTAAGGDWRGIVAGRSTWRGRFVELDLRDAGLRDSKLEEASFERCDLRGVDLRRRDDLPALGIAARTRFVECDLRGAKVEGWRLDGVVFERCRMHGIEGTPVVEGEVQVADADLSEAGDGGADAVGSARLVAAWRGTGGA